MPDHAASHPSDVLLRAFAVGKLTGDETSAIADHLSVCRACCARLDAAGSADPLLAQLRAATDADEEESGERAGAVAVLRGKFRSPPAAGTSTTWAYGERPGPTPAGDTPPIPGRIGEYEILGEVGRGGMGVVYKARDTRLSREVALKMVLSGRYASGTERLRFRLEAELSARVQHPNVVQVYEAGEHDGCPFLAMEWVGGGTLADRLDERPWPPAEAAALVETLARAVHAAHEQGVVHRDLKPANVLLAGVVGGQCSADGEDKKPGPSELSTPHSLPPTVTPKVADFGLARSLASRGGVTRTGVVVGTPEYMAPEQAAGDGARVAPEADVYALGGILYRLLAGRTPFRGDSAFDVLRLVVLAEPPPPRRWNRRVPPDLEAVCLRCLAKKPHERYPTAADLAGELRRFLDGKPVTARPVGAASRAWRAVKRNPVVAGATAAVILSLSVGLGAALVKADEANEEAEKTKRALAERDEKEKEREKAVAEHEKAHAAEKAAVAEALRNSRLALYSRELGDARRWLSEEDVSLAEDSLEACPADLRGWEWKFTKRWLDRRAGHLAPVAGAFIPSCVAVSPDGRWVAAGGKEYDPEQNPLASVADSFVWLWDLRKGGPPVKLPGRFLPVLNGAAITGLTFDQDCRFLAASAPPLSDLAERGAALRVWDVTDTAKPVLEVPPDPPFRVAAVRFTPGAVSAVVASPDPGLPTKLVTWRLGEKAAPGAVEFDGKDGVSCAAFAPGGTRLVLVGPRENTPAAPGRPQFARVVQTDGKPIGKAVAVDPLVKWVAFAPSGPGGRGVVFGHSGGFPRPDGLVAWDEESGTTGRQLERPMHNVDHLQVRSDGRVVPGHDSDSPPQAWDSATGNLETLPRFPYPGPLAYFPDGRRLAVGTPTGARVWDPVEAHDRALGVPDEAIDRFVLLPGNRVALLSEPHPLVEDCRVWVTGLEGGAVRELNPEPAAEGYYAAARVGDWLALCARVGEKPTQTLLCDPATGKVVDRWDRPDVSTPALLAADAAGRRVAFSQIRHDGEFHDWLVHVRNAATGKPERTLVASRRRDSLDGLAVSRNGKYVAAAFGKGRPDVDVFRDFPGAVAVWDADTGAAVRTFEGIPGDASRVAFSPDDSLLALCGTRGVRIWRTGDWSFRDLAPPGGAGEHVRVVKSIDFSPDGTRLVACGNETVVMWDVASGQAVLSIPRSCSQAAFAPDGRRLLAASGGKVFVYDARP